MTVVSFYTKDTPYEKEAEYLRASLDNLGVDHDIRPLPSQGSWVQNCALKANFIRTMQEELAKDFWWLDADAELLRHLPDLSAEGIDIAAYIQDDWNLRSGTVFFSNSSASRGVVSIWCDYCETYPFIWDQVLLMIAIHNYRINSQLNVRNLPEAYFKKSEKNARRELMSNLRQILGLQHKTVVRQNQASRKFKNYFTDTKNSVSTPKKRNEISNTALPNDVKNTLKTSKSILIDIEKDIIQFANRESQVG